MKLWSSEHGIRRTWSDHPTPTLCSRVLPRTHHEHHQRHGGPFCWPCTPRMLLGTAGDLFFLSSVFATLPERCIYFFSVLWPSTATQQQLNTFGAGNCSKKAIPPPFKLCELQITLIMLNILFFKGNILNLWKLTNFVNIYHDGIISARLAENLLVGQI